MANAILQEIYSAREAIMAEFNNDLGAYLRDAAQRAIASNHPVAREIKQRQLRRSATASEPSAKSHHATELPSAVETARAGNPVG